MNIEVLGTGCPKCNLLEATARAAADKLGVDYELTHIKDISELMNRGVMVTPALSVNGTIVASGRVPRESEISAMLTRFVTDPTRPGSPG